MKSIKNYIIIAVLILLPSVSAFAQLERSAGMIKSTLIGLEYQVKAGLSIGGTAPIPLPVEIRKITGYDPLLCMSLEGNVTKWINPEGHWGVRIGLRMENKAMQTDARVKNYGMEIIGTGGERVKGNWTGDVRTKVSNNYLTFPVTAAYKLTKRFNVTLGPYFSYVMKGDFSGFVHNGYLREGNPTGDKVVFEGDKSAAYDFSKSLRKFQWGAQVGGEWKALKHLNVYGDLTWGLNDVFKKDFNTITFAMYPIYLNVGMSYVF